MGLGGFVAQPAHWRVMADLGLLSLFAGLYSVPMYALIQLRSQPTHRARIIAANNILNALFMIGSSVIAGALLKAGFTIPQIFLFTGIANAVVAFYIFMLVPEYLLRFVAWVLSRLVYRFEVQGRRAHPGRGRGGAGLQPRELRRRGAADGGEPAADPLHHGPPHLPRAGARLAVQAGQGDPDRAAEGRPGRLRSAPSHARCRCCARATCSRIFPEGAITRDGSLQPFKGGVMKILEAARAEGIDAPVIPMALTNLWGSYFSRVEVRDGENVAMVRPFRRGFFSRVGLNVGSADAARPRCSPRPCSDA